MSTAIEWTDETWNPVTGCTKVSAGCKHCYAETVAERFWAAQYPTVPTTEREREDGLVDVDHLVTRPRRFSDVMTHEDRLFAPLSWRNPRRVFVNSMSDLFHENLPDEFIDRVFAVMALTPQHTYQILTKRPERMHEFMVRLDRDIRLPSGTHQRFKGWAESILNDRKDYETMVTSEWPLPNVWLGVSCENQETADARIPLLLQTPAAIRFVSAEPLLSLFDLEAYLTRPGECLYIDSRPTRGLDWVITGGESGPQARPCQIEWIRSIVQQCQRADVPVFVKQLGTRPTHLDGLYQKALTLRDRKGGDLAEWSEDLRVREWPRRAA